MQAFESKRRAEEEAEAAAEQEVEKELSAVGVDVGCDPMSVVMS